MGKKKLTRNEIYFIIIFALFLIIGLFGHYRSKEDRRVILRDYEITKGYFVRYDKVGGSGIPYITYTYNVDEKKYTRQVQGLVRYEDCYKSDCTNKIFWVVYSSKSPEKSLIDLTQEIQDKGESSFPEVLDNFK